ncbi:hypothetical protein FACS1894166_05390 [Bacilli bacterium]|nr:hypothetical protein FACS1894166_05390 [Bacilli bacterium]
METRIERYKIYRDEIANESTLISKVAVGSKAINTYRERIDRIDSTILENMNLDRNLLKLVSINQRSAKESETMVHFLNIIEEKKMTNIKEEIDTTLAKYTYEPIMAPNGQISIS